VPPEAVAADGAAEARRDRERISQLVGMSVAARLLAREIVRDLASDARAIADAGRLREVLGCDENAAHKLSASLAAWMLDRARRVAARCEEHAGLWIAEAYRTEGRAEALREAAARRPEPAGAEPPGE
jgi:hypothetical protein